MGSFLVAVDLTPSSRSMFDMAMREAKQENADLVLVHAFRPGMRLGAIYRDGALDPIRELEAEMKLDEAVQFTTEWADVARAEGLNVQIVANDSEPARLILDAAQEHDVDRIVMGRHARGAVAEFILGSTADKVLRHATVPVLVVPLDQ